MLWDNQSGEPGMAEDLGTKLAWLKNLRRYFTVKSGQGNRSGYPDRRRGMTTLASLRKARG